MHSRHFAFNYLKQVKKGCKLISENNEEQISLGCRSLW